MWNQNLNEVSVISFFVHTSVLTLLWAPNMSGHWSDCLELTKMGNHICEPKLPAKLVFWNFGQQTFSYALLISRGVSNEDSTSFIIVVIFFCGCVPEVVVPSCAVGFLYIPKKLGLYILLLCSLMMCAYTQVHYGPMVVFVCLHIKLPCYHHYADLSEGIAFLKCLSGNSVSSVCLRFSQF